MRPVYVTVATELEGMAISVNGEKVATSDSIGYQKEVGPLAPGANVFTGKVLVGKEEQEMNRNVDLVSSAEASPAEVIDLTIQVMSFTVESNVEDGKVLLDDEAVATLENGEAEIGPFAWHEGMTVKVVKSFESGDVESSAYELGSYDNGNIITLQIDSAVNEETVWYFLNDFYSQVNSFLSDYNKFQVVFSVNYDTNYTDGDNESVYNNLKYTKAIFEYDEERGALTISDLGGKDDVIVTKD